MQDTRPTCPRKARSWAQKTDPNYRLRLDRYTKEYLQQYSEKNRVSDIRVELGIPVTTKGHPDQTRWEEIKGWMQKRLEEYIEIPDLYFQSFVADDMVENLALKELLENTDREPRYHTKWLLYYHMKYKRRRIAKEKAVYTESPVEQSDASVFMEETQEDSQDAMRVSTLLNPLD